MKKGLKIVIVVVVFLVLMGYLFGGGVEKQAQNELEKIENQVALDAEKQYEIAKKNGSTMDAYVQAGMVAASYLQANDEENYKKWKDIESKEGEIVGIPAQ